MIPVAEDLRILPCAVTLASSAPTPGLQDSRSVGTASAKAVAAYLCSKAEAEFGTQGQLRPPS